MRLSSRSSSIIHRQQHERDRDGMTASALCSFYFLSQVNALSQVGNKMYLFLAFSSFSFLVANLPFSVFACVEHHSK